MIGSTPNELTSVIGDGDYFDYYYILIPVICCPIDEGINSAK